MEETLFDKILSGEIPCEKIYENEHVLAFLDIAPVNPGHTLVIPKARARNLLDMQQTDWLHVAEAIHYLAPKIKDALEADGINIHVNTEAAAGQTVFHPHAHIIPRFENDGHAMWSGSSYADGEAPTVAQKIKNAL